MSEQRRDRHRRGTRRSAIVAFVVAGLAVASATPAMAVTCGTSSSPYHAIYDGGFESELTLPGWAATPGVIQPRSLISSELQPYSGNIFAHLDRTPLAIPIVYQIFNMPAGCMSYTLDFRLHVGTTQPNNVGPVDKLKVTLSTYGSTSHPVSQSWTFSNTQAFSGWYGDPNTLVYAGIPIPLYGLPQYGGLFELKFEAYEGSQLVTAPHTWFNIDNVDVYTRPFF